LKSDLDHNEKLPDITPVYEFESMSIYEFAMLFEAYFKKIPNIDEGDDDENADLVDDNEPRDIIRQTNALLLVQ
jgi:hypothetical protein